MFENLGGFLNFDDSKVLGVFGGFRLFSVFCLVFGVSCFVFVLGFGWLPHN